MRSLLLLLIIKSAAHACEHAPLDSEDEDRCDRVRDRDRDAEAQPAGLDRVLDVDDLGDGRVARGVEVLQALIIIINNNNNNKGA